jgi:hypothetical protein
VEIYEIVVILSCPSGGRITIADSHVKAPGDDFTKTKRGTLTKKRMQQMVSTLALFDEIVERGRTGKILEDYEK